MVEEARPDLGDDDLAQFAVPCGLERPDAEMVRERRMYGEAVDRRHPHQDLSADRAAGVELPAGLDAALAEAPVGMAVIVVRPAAARVLLLRHHGAGGTGRTAPEQAAKPVIQHVVQRR